MSRFACCAVLALAVSLVAPPATAQTDATARARAVSAKVAAQIGEHSPEAAAVAAQLAGALIAEGQAEEALRIVRRALPDARAQLGPADAITANLIALEGSSLMLLGRDREAEPSLRSAVAAWTALGWGETSPTRTLRTNHATVLHRLGRDSEAEAVLRPLLGQPDLSPTDAAYAWTVLGSALHGLGRFDEALEASRLGADLSATALGADHRDALRARSNLAVVLSELGRDDEALALLRADADRSASLFGPSDPLSEKLRYDLAAALHAAGRPLAAEPLLADLAAEGRDEALRVRALHHLALTRLALGRTEQAVAAEREAVTLREPDGDSADLAAGLVTLGDALAAVGEVEQGLAILRRAEAMADRLDASWTLKSGAALALGEALLAADRPDEARIALARAVTLADAALPPGHPRRLDRDHALARALTGVGRSGEALALLRRDAPLALDRRRGRGGAGAIDAWGSGHALFSALVEAAWIEADRP